MYILSNEMKLLCILCAYRVACVSGADGRHRPNFRVADIF